MTPPTVTIAVQPPTLPVYTGEECFSLLQYAAAAHYIECTGESLAAFSMLSFAQMDWWQQKTLAHIRATRQRWDAINPWKRPEESR